MSLNANEEMLAGYADPDASLNTGYADTDADLCIRIMSLCCMLPRVHEPEY